MLPIGSMLFDNSLTELLEKEVWKNNKWSKRREGCTGMKWDSEMQAKEILWVKVMQMKRG